MYSRYIYLTSKLKERKDVIDAGSEKVFNKHLELYRKKHSRMQRALSRATQYEDPEDWLADESNQIIPLFVWDSDHSKKTIKTANELVESSDLEVAREDIKGFLTYECGESEFPYEEGDIALTSNEKGSYIQFQIFDRIILNNGVYYIYSFKKKRYKYPFKLGGIKKALKGKIPEWYSKESVEIHRDEISSLINER